MLRQVAEEVWVADGDLWPAFGMWFPVRCVIVRVGDALWVHSPIDLRAVADEIDALGEVRWIVNPNGFHGKWVGDACARWPSAELVCSTAHALLGTELPPSTPLDPVPPAAWDDAFEVALIDGCPRVKESVFLHRASGTLIVTDLVFNVHASKSWVMSLVFRLVGAWKRPAQSRLWRSVTKDRAAAGASVERMLAWPFERVIMAHGDIIERDAPAAMASALRWMREGSRTLANGSERG